MNTNIETFLAKMTRAEQLEWLQNELVLEENSLASADHKSSRSIEINHINGTKQNIQQIKSLIKARS